MSFVTAPPYQPKHKNLSRACRGIRVVTAASLFDGHDAGTCPGLQPGGNIMRRIIQSTGAEVIHLGHDRSVEDIF